MKKGSATIEKKSLPKKIKIIKSSKQTHWYADHLGIILNVVGIWRENYLTDYKNKRGLYMVDPNDCEIVEE